MIKLARDHGWDLMPSKMVKSLMRQNGPPISQPNTPAPTRTSTPRSLSCEEPSEDILLQTDPRKTAGLTQLPCFLHITNQIPDSSPGQCEGRRGNARGVPLLEHLQIETPEQGTRIPCNLPWFVSFQLHGVPPLRFWVIQVCDCPHPVRKFTSVRAGLAQLHEAPPPHRLLLLWVSFLDLN